MSKLITSRGEELTENIEITSEVTNYYENLYASREEIIDDIDLNSIIQENVPTLDDMSALRLEGRLTYTCLLYTSPSPRDS